TCGGNGAVYGAFTSRKLCRRLSINVPAVTLSLRRVRGWTQAQQGESDRNCEGDDHGAHLECPGVAGAQGVRGCGSGGLVSGGGGGDGREDGESDRAADLDRGGRDARDEPGVLLADAGDGSQRGRHEREPEAGAEDDQGREHAAEVGAVGVEVAEEEHPERSGRGTCGDERADADAGDNLRDGAGGGDQCERDGHERNARRQRPGTETVLEVERSVG